MKKPIFALLLIFTIALAGAGFASSRALAAGGGTEVTARALLPESDDRYIRLTKPRDVWRDDEVLAIAEANSSDSRIVLYSFPTADEPNGKFREFKNRIDLKGIARFGHYLIFIESNNLSYLDYTSAEATSNQFMADGKAVGASNFALSGDFVALNASDGATISFYTLSESEGALTLVKSERTMTVGIETDNGIALALNADKSLFVYYRGDVYRQTADLAEARFPTPGGQLPVQCIAADGNKVYFTTSSPGFFSIDFDHNGQIENYDGIVDNRTTSLTRLGAPYGMAVYGGKILIADNKNNAVLEFDPAASALTGYSVARTGDTAGRLGSDAADVATDESGAHYFADTENNRIEIVKPSGEIELIGLGDFSPSRIATSADALFVAGTRGGQYLYQIRSKADPGAIGRESVASTAIVGAAFADGYFYYATEWQTQKIAEFRRVAVTVDPKTGVETGGDETLYSRQGIVPAAVASDVEGRVYFCFEADSSGKYGVYVRSGEGWDGSASGSELIGESIMLDAKPLKMQADFEGNLFVLLGGGNVKKFKRAEDGTYSEDADGARHVAPDGNLAAQFEGGDPAPVSFSFCFASETAAFLYPDGLAAATEELGIATPLDVLVPEDCRLLAPAEPLADDLDLLRGAFDVKKVPLGTNLYFFDPYSLRANESFPYMGYKKLKGDLNAIVAGYAAGGAYAVLLFSDESDERAGGALVSANKLVGLVGGEDSDDGFTVRDPEFVAGRTITRTNAFKYPLLADGFSVTADENGAPIGLAKNTPVTLVSEYEIALCTLDRSDGTTGGRMKFFLASFRRGDATVSSFVPASMVVRSLASSDERAEEEVRILRPGKKGVKVFSDEELTEEFAVISEKCPVVVLERGDKWAQIEFMRGNTYVRGYVPLSAVKDHGANLGVVVAAICLFALSLAATAIYYLVRPKEKIGDENGSASGGDR